MKMTFKPYNINFSLCEITQAADIKFAWGKIHEDTVTQIIPWVKCRDFLTDCLWAKFYKKDVTDIYGFKFKHSTRIEPITTLLIKTDSDISTKLSFLHDFEKQVHWRRTTIFETDKSDIKVIIGSKNWMYSSVHLSLYTFLIRLLTYPLLDPVLFGNDFLHPDNTYVEAIEKLDIVKLLKFRKEVFSEHRFQKDLGSNHDNGGVYTFALRMNLGTSLVFFKTLHEKYSNV